MYVLNFLMEKEQECNREIAAYRATRSGSVRHPLPCLLPWSLDILPQPLL